MGPPEIGPAPTRIRVSFNGFYFTFNFVCVSTFHFDPVHALRFILSFSMKGKLIMMRIGSGFQLASIWREKKDLMKSSLECNLMVVLNLVFMENPQELELLGYFTK